VLPPINLTPVRARAKTKPTHEASPIVFRITTNGAWCSSSSRSPWWRCLRDRDRGGPRAVAADEAQRAVCDRPRRPALAIPPGHGSAAEPSSPTRRPHCGATRSRTRPHSRRLVSAGQHPPEDGPLIRTATCRPTKTIRARRLSPYVDARTRRVGHHRRRRRTASGSGTDVVVRANADLDPATNACLFSGHRVGSLTLVLIVRADTARSGKASRPCCC
jgi:hypothetical protein